MLNTIYTIGKEISDGRDQWEDILGFPKIGPKDEEKRLYALNVIFDLDQKAVTVAKENLQSYYPNDKESLKKWRSIKILGGNNKSIYLTVDAGKLEQLEKSFFGKQNENGQFPERGEFLEAIDAVSPELKESVFYKVLETLPALQSSFTSRFQDEKGNLSIAKISTDFSLGKNEKIVLVLTSVKSNFWNLDNVLLGHLEGYDAFISKRFFSKASQSQTEAASAQKLCYASGEWRDDVREVEFSGRYNINKFFVKTTKNYASEFNSKHYHKNYQVSGEIETFLDRGSDFLLNNLTTDIADIRHVIIPQFLNQDYLDIKYLNPLSRKADLLFKLTDWKELKNYLDDTSDFPGFYWLNFMAIDSDGNYFKAGNLIRDVSRLHFNLVLDALKEVGELLQPWLGDKYGFNFYTVYKSIPVRKDKEKVNKALLLFASVLEQRPIEPQSLYQHFSELLLCHWFGRYKSYTNIFPTDKFDFAARDAVFKYLAFMYALRKLNLLKENSQFMETEKSTGLAIGEEIEAFLDKMGFDQSQRALFFLGQVLNRIVRKQTEKGHKKNALDKLNYNGMDRASIFRLANELFEASRHYDITESIKWNWGRFSELFDFQSWKMSPQEALFFILTGYTYFIKAKQPSENATQNQ